MRLASTVLLLTFGGTAFAGAALDDDKKTTPTRTTDPAAAPDTLAVAEEKVDYGIDLRIRSVHLPEFMLGWFVARAPGGAGNLGLGVDFVRRRGNLELQLGFEYEHINVDEGVFIEKNHTVPQDAADYLLASKDAPENFGWFSIEFTFLNHVPINKYVSFRYGFGGGIGILQGGVYRYDVQCSAGATNDNPGQACTPPQKGGTATVVPDNGGGPEPAKYDLPPVFPVLNAIIGAQIHPFDKAVINFEMGIRTLPFIGMSAGYFF